ncbi:MAG: zinc ribbon domain-containing protein [Peptococcaceae bacterium]|nr:zinc ribbon domain-containing protein [Peptococcaceae bacterium]
MLFALLILFLNLLIPICIGVYVYRDARARGMEPVLWTLAAVLIPSFIGLIIYLIARTKYSVLRCARCGAVVEEDYSVCPQCGISLQASCPSCGRTVQPEWNVCAHCGAALSQYREKNIVEPPGVGKTLWVALGIVAVLVLLLFFVLASNLVWYVIPQGINVMHHFI